MSIREKWLQVVEARTNALFVVRAVSDIEHAKEVVHGKGCQCNSCVISAEKSGNWGIEDLNTSGSFSGRFEKIKQRRGFKLTFKQDNE